MKSPWRLAAAALVAGCFLSCDRAKVETQAAASQETTALQNQKPAPPPKFDSLDLGVARPIAPPEDSAPQMPPTVTLVPLSPTRSPSPAEKLASLPPSERARAIFALLPSLPPEALANAAERAIENLPDAEYRTLALPVITDAKTHGQVLSVMFADLLERPDPITLPTLLTIARNPNHPFAPSALDALRLLLGADYDTDWSRWEEGIRHKLAKSPASQ